MEIQIESCVNEIIGIEPVTALYCAMDIHLTPELEKMVQSHLDSGRYDSASAVVDTALRLLNEQCSADDLWKWDVRQKIEDGLKSLRESKGIDGEIFFDRLEAEMDADERSNLK